MVGKGGGVGPLDSEASKKEHGGTEGGGDNGGRNVRLGHAAKMFRPIFSLGRGKIDKDSDSTIKTWETQVDHGSEPAGTKSPRLLRCSHRGNEMKRTERMDRGKR